MLEKQIESKVCEYAKTKGLLVYKFTSPARAAVPDRMFILPNGIVFFIEFKRSGASPTIPQIREHQRLRGHGVKVFVTDDAHEGCALIDSMVNAHANP